MRKSSLAKLVLEVRTGFWFRPLLMLGAGVGLGLLGVALDHWLIASETLSPFGTHASPSGARSLLSVAAGALATTLAISLSMTMVTVQLASSQYTPRLLRRFLGDRFAQGVIGAFLGTIAYLFLVLRAVRSPEEGDPFVPLMSLSAAVLLTLTCLGLLVVFLHRTMRTMQASTIIARVGRETIQMIRALDTTAPASTSPIVGEPICVIRSTSPGYVQLIDDEAIRRRLPEGITLACRNAAPGDFVLVGSPLLSLYGSCDATDEVVTAIRDCFALGTERTAESDLLFGIRQLVDVALKALSPGINDVTTAVMVVNELGAVLQAVASTDLPADGWCVRVDEHGPPYRFRTLDLDTCLELAFGEIEAASEHHPRVRARMVELLSSIRRQATSVDVGRSVGRRELQLRYPTDLALGSMTSSSPLTHAPIATASADK